MPTEIAAVLFQEDPMGINFETNTDEYAAEANDIASGLWNTTSTDELADLVHTTFVQWFSPVDAGPRERYVTIASRIWELGVDETSASE